MSRYMDSPPAAGTPAYEAPSGWVGWVAFAGIMMIMLGVFHVVQGLVALFNDDYFLVRPSRLVVSVDFTTWGWVHVIAGLVVVVAGFCVFAGQVWARALGTVMALASAVLNLGFLAAYPVWSLIMIAFDVVIIMALTVHGSEIKASQG